MEQKTEYVRARIDLKTKRAAEAILAKIGIRPSDAIRMFYQQIIIHKGLPFELKAMNKKTVKATKDLKARKT